MPLVQRTVADGIEWVDNTSGEAVAGIRNDGTVWGKGPQQASSGAAGPPGQQGLPGEKGEAGQDGAGIQAQAVTISPPRDLASNIAATKAIINVLHDAGITV